MTYVIGTAGHVDHGKSSLVQALTGINPDRLAEEQAREMTIDLGFAWMTLPGGESVGIVDVPGHQDFIENMLAGVGGIELVLFVIAADEGVMPQTREHLAILDLLQVPGGVVALTKTDLIEDPDWIGLVTLDIGEALAGTVLESAPIVPVSARTGQGLDELVDTLDRLLAERQPRPDRGRPRLPVDRVFTISGFGTVVTGTLTDGSLRVGDEVEIVPAGLRGRVRGLQSHKETVEVAGPGSRVAINLAGVAKEAIKRGDVVCRPGLLNGTDLIDAQFRHLSDAGRPLKHNAEVKFYSGAAESVAHIRLVGDRELAPGASGWLQLRLTDPLALDKGDRFILRYPSPGQTIGGGIILDAHPSHRWRRFKREVIERFETLAAGSPEELILQALEGQIALQAAQLISMTGLGADEVKTAIPQLEQSGSLFRLAGDWLVAQAAWARVTDRIRRELAAFHQHYPLRPGMPREALRSRLEADGKLFNLLVATAAGEEILADEGAVVRLPDHSVHFNEQQQAAIDRLRRVIQTNPYSPPNVKEAATITGDDVLQALVEQGQIAQVSPEVLFDAETYRQMVEAIKDYIQQQGSISVGQARDLFNSSRKYVLALLEYMDATGVTVRRGDERVLR